jgi:hypothetical protein
VSEDVVERVTELERRIADLKARWPKHSVPPAMLIELEELEEQLERARAESGERKRAGKRRDA